MKGFRSRLRRCLLLYLEHYNQMDVQLSSRSRAITATASSALTLADMFKKEKITVYSILICYTSRRKKFMQLQQIFFLLRLHKTFLVSP